MGLYYKKKYIYIYRSFILLKFNGLLVGSETGALFFLPYQAGLHLFEALYRINSSLEEFAFPN